MIRVNKTVKTLFDLSGWQMVTPNTLTLGVFLYYSANDIHINVNSWVSNYMKYILLSGALPYINIFEALSELSLELIALLDQNCSLKYRLLIKYDIQLSSCFS